MGEHSYITAYEESNVYNISHNCNTFLYFHIEFCGYMLFI